MSAAKRVGMMLHEHANELAQKYRWKAENIVRFFDGLGMTKEQKISFLADELAGAYMQGEWRKYEDDHERS